MFGRLASTCARRTQDARFGSRARHWRDMNPNHQDGCGQDGLQEKVDSKGIRWKKVYVGGGAHFNNWLEQAKEILRVKENLNQILVHHTGKDMKRIEEDTDRDFFMSGVEAVDYGLIDKVMASRDDLETKEETEA